MTRPTTSPTTRATPAAAREDSGELLQASAAARAAWAPLGVVVAEQVFSPYYLERRARVPADRPLRAADLYLACACGRGDPRAITLFTERYLPSVRKLLTQARVPPALADDVADELIGRLFAPLEGETALIAAYSGRGELGAWTRSVALKTALKVMRRQRHQLPFEGEHEVPLADPELVYLRELYAAELNGVLREAFAALTREERAILRQYYRHRLTIDDLGRLYSLHRASAARRIANARDHLVREVRARASQRLGLGDPSLDSILHLVASRLRMEHLLRTTQVVDS